MGRRRKPKTIEEIRADAAMHEKLVFWIAVVPAGIVLLGVLLAWCGGG